MKTRESKALNTKNIAKQLYVQLDDIVYQKIDENGRHPAQEPMPKKYEDVYVANVMSSSKAVKYYLARKHIPTSRPRLK